MDNLDIHREVDAVVGSLPPLAPDPARRARETSPWTRTAAAVQGDLRALCDDPLIQALITEASILAHTDSPLLDDTLNVLLAMAGEKAPTANHCLGPCGLSQYVMLLLAATIQRAAGDGAGADRLLAGYVDKLRLWHFQGSDTVLRSDGGEQVLPDKELSVSDLSDHRGFQASQRAEGKRGRRHGPQKARKSRLDASMAHHADVAVSQGATRKAVALTLWPGLSLTAGVKRVKRLVDHHRSLADCPHCAH